jgi:hypothetical protein
MDPEALQEEKGKRRILSPPGTEFRKPDQKPVSLLTAIYQLVNNYSIHSQLN